MMRTTDALSPVLATFPAKQAGRDANSQTRTSVTGAGRAPAQGEERNTGALLVGVPVYGELLRRPPGLAIQNFVHSPRIVTGEGAPDHLRPSGSPVTRLANQRAIDTYRDLAGRLEASAYPPSLAVDVYV